MKLFMPERVYFEPAALEYPLGQKLKKLFTEMQIPILQTSSHQRITGIPGKTEQEKYVHAKRTLVVGVKKTMDLDVCRPSADYEFSLGTNCPGNCEYCYLQTTQGKRPYIRVYVNLEEIFESILKHIEKHKPNITTFEVASTSDPVALEHLTGSLKKTIEFFGSLAYGRLRVVTKFADVDSLLDIWHNHHTRFRFSINSRYVIHHFEHTTSSLEERLEAAKKISEANYPTGFIVAPIMVYEGWIEEYRELFDGLKEKVAPSAQEDLTFELIQHRYTNSARKLILQRFPHTRLDMDDAKRVKKWGPYGRYKYVYPKEEAQEIQAYLTQLIMDRFPKSKIEYFT